MTAHTGSIKIELEITSRKKKSFVENFKYLLKNDIYDKSII